MRFRNLTICGLSALIASAASATEPTATTSAITIVPFAVPVAVPVAVVERPTLFYGVTGYAPPNAKNAVDVTPSSPRELATSESTTLREQAALVLKRHCAECHQGTEARGGLALFDDAGRLLPQLPRQLVVDATDPTPEIGPAMPPEGRTKLSADERRTLKQWARMPKSFVY